MLDFVLGFAVSYLLVVVVVQRARQRAQCKRYEKYILDLSFAHASALQWHYKRYRMIEDENARLSTATSPVSLADLFEYTKTLSRQ